MEAQERQIGETTYGVTPFGAKQGLRVLARLMKIVGPGVGGLKDGGEEEALSRLLSALDPSDVVELAEAFAERAVAKHPDHKMAPLPLVQWFDQHFADRYDELVGFVIFAAEVNFAKSLKRGKGLFAQLGLSGRFQSPSSSKSSGSGSESSPAGGTS